MPTVLEALRSLSPANRVLIAIGVAVVVLWVWTSLQARWRDRARTVYVIPDDATFEHQGERASPRQEPPAASTPGPVGPVNSDVIPESAPAPAAPPHAGADDADASVPPAVVASEAPGAATQAPPWAPDWAEGRRLCPCCGYATDFTPAHRCSLCDWEEPPEPVLDDDHMMPPNPDDLLDDARARYRATGSALTPEDRTEWLGPLTPSMIQLRRQLRDRLEYLRSGDRPDSSETWEAIGRIIDDLHQEQERQRLDT